ncbi:hypothetical protein BCEP4_430020 [Burkholderia cepacia]|nr:hypothetical protein BCEP4_430020 [Burkholderia cepacia]
MHWTRQSPTARACRSWRAHETLADDPPVCRRRARDRNRPSGAMLAALGKPRADWQAPQPGLTAIGRVEPSRPFIETDYHSSDKIACDIQCAYL